MKIQSISERREAEILNQLSVSDDQGFSDLYMTYRTVFFRRAIFRGVPVAEAEELVDDVFVDFMRQWNDFRGRNREGERASLETYLTRILYNKCADFSRRQKRTAEIFEGSATASSDYDTQVADAASPDPSPADLVSLMQDRNQLMHCLKKLPAEQAEVVLLAYVEDWTMNELAEKQTCSANTIKSRLRIAKENLVRCLTQPLRRGG